MTKRRLPVMPSAIAMARRIREGMSLEEICAQYQRAPKTIIARLNNAGYSNDGVERQRHPAAAVLKPWRIIPRFMEEAACVEADPAIFYAEWEVGHGVIAKQAKVVCGRCPVRMECLKYALENHERYGIWGGLTTGERRRLLKEGRAA